MAQIVACWTIGSSHSRDWVPVSRLRGDTRPEIFKQGLLGRVVLKADIVVLGGTQRRRDIMGDDVDIENIFGDLNNIFGGALGNIGFGNLQQMRFVVVNTVNSFT